MMNVFIINGGHAFAHSPGGFNKTLLERTQSFFEAQKGYQVKTTQIGSDFDLTEEVEKYKWADLIIYHTPIWWFQVPFKFKEYIDKVFTAGHNTGIYTSDGRSRTNPAINYGTGGSLHGKKYMVTSSWNAPKEAFTLAGEFFDQKSVDEGVLFGFHKMNQFIGLDLLGSTHFHDMEKNADVERELAKYDNFLNEIFKNKNSQALAS
ncbi:NAD(P)H-dependent oxidoreductase [Leeuwenhoekiella nanhaiensis]|uniref:NADPH quinone reductase MdaB n=1 Tax=Leeuwenhoekiella nanhaiensis TaxID=1655491 RepID=A0A2G1VPM1_9FLAO|nr:NAD(P)H-dependent oxidoreductase [Leeuwenhoekiella nanhaiensis]PHQ28694.1 NADPH quinone reductase MdaB [Leeuwenhoekiella nanhaiensis]